MQLAHLGAGLDPQHILRRDSGVHVAEANVVKAALLVLGDRRGEVGDYVDMDLLQCRLGRAPPVVDGTELQRLLRSPSAHLVGTGSDQCFGLGPPGVLTTGLDGLLADDGGDGREERHLGYEVAARLRQLDHEGVVVGRGHPAQGGGLLGFDVFVAVDQGNFGRVVTLQLGSAAPRVDEVFGRDLVAVRELDVLA